MVLQSGYFRRTLLWLVVNCMVSGVISTHFRGGIFMVRPKPGGTQREMEISFRISWRRDYGGGECNSNGQNISGLGSLSCQYGCSGNIGTLSYVCTDFSTTENWQYGENSFSYVFPATVNKTVAVGFTGCCWLFPLGYSWNVSTTFSLTTRTDTGQINSSPRAITAPVVRLQQGCNHTIPLAVSDPDNDIIRCRWAVGVECAEFCSGFPGAHLDSNSCTITYMAGNTGYNAAALMIEDFISGSTRPLSSVALQFLVLVVSSTELCSQQPKFIDPTLPQGSCVSINAGKTFTTQLTAASHSSSVSIVEIQTVSPIGVTKGTLLHIQSTFTYYVNITWLPTTSQLNQVHLFCYTALNSLGSASEQTCIQLLAGYLPPTPYPGSPMPNHQKVYPSNATFHIKFDKDIQRPSVIAFIIFYEFISEVEVYKIDASSSLEVTFSHPTKITVKPNYLFTEKVIYYIVLKEGTVQGIEGCGLKNKAVANKTFWNFQVMDITPPNITFIKNPVKVNTPENITFEWKSNENVTWECYLITSNIILFINCSNGSWSGYGLEMGNYTLNISACDAAGNQAFSSHNFVIDFTIPEIKGNDVTVFENDKVAVVQIERSELLNSEIAIHVATLDRTAIAGLDYTAVSQIFKFASGQSTANVSIPIKDDDIALESNVTFIVAIVTYGDAIVLSNSTVTIVDNDHVPKINISNATVFENDGTVSIQVERSEGLNRNLLMDFTTVGGTAVAGEDYITVFKKVIFLSNQSTVIVDIPIRDDIIPQEPDIYFFVEIIFNTNTIARSIVTIVDDDYVQVKGNDVTVFENDEVAVVQIERSGPFISGISIHVTTLDGTAIADVDYTAVSQTFKFTYGQSTVNVSIPIRDDDIALESNVTFTVTIITYGNIIVLSNSTVTIVDNDHVPKINIRDATIFENDGIVSIQVERSEGLDRILMMDVTTVDGTAIAGEDYTTVLKKITFLSHQSTVIVNIPIRDDTISREPDKYFFVEIIFNANTIAQSIVTIADNDHDTMVEFSSSSYIGSESLKGVPVTVLITQGTISRGEKIVVNIVATSHSPVSAEGYNKDFSSLSVPITFTNHTSEVSSVILVFQDKIIEDTEIFDLSIDIPSYLKHRLSAGRQRNAIASIIDSTIIKCPANFKEIAMQKSNSNKMVRKEIRSAIKNALDIPKNVTTDKDAFLKLAASLKVENSTEKFVQFQNAINEISEASYEACHGSDSNLVLPEETQALIDKFEKVVQDNKSTEARHSFGRLLCLRQKFQTNNTLVVKRHISTKDLLNKWYKDLSKTDYSVLFFKKDTGDPRTLAFVVDNTGSMREEINATKEIIKAIIKAEKYKEKSDFRYILGTFNDPEVGEARRYDSSQLVELNELKRDVEAIKAHAGGDCPELGMEGIYRALLLSYENSHVIVLTDAGCLDYEKKSNVIRLADLSHVKVHFFFSGTGCGNNFLHYREVQRATGGISVNTIESFDSLTSFIYKLSPRESKRSIHSKDSYLSLSHKCKIFKISVFAIKFELVVNQNSKFIKIYDPLGYSVTSQHISDELSGYISNGQPRNGSWKICSVDGASNFTITKKEILDFSVDYYQDGYYSSAIPMAGNVSILSVFTTQLDNILVDSNLTLSFISENNKFVWSTPLLICSGYLLGRIVIPSVNFVYRLSGNDKFGNPFVYTKRSSINVPRKPYFLENILDGSGNKTIYTGNKDFIYFSLKSTNAATSALSFNIVASTSPSVLMLRYQATVTVKPNDVEIIVVTVETKGTDLLGSYVIKVTASSEDLILTKSQSIILVKPDESSCPCLNGGTCRYSSSHGRTFIHCTCPTGYFGSRCQIEI